MGHERGGQNSAKTERVKWAKEISKPPQATSSSSSPNLFSIHFSTFSLLSLSLLLSILFIYSFFFLKKFLIIFNRVESVVFRINFSKSRMILLISNFRGNIVKKKKKEWLRTMMHPLFPPTSLKFPRESLTSLSNAIIRTTSPPHLSAFFNHSKRINHPSRVARITLVPCRNFVAVLPSRRRYQTDTVSVGSGNKEKMISMRCPFPFNVYDSPMDRSNFMI